MNEWDAQTILAMVCVIGALVGLILLIHFYLMPTFIWPVMDAPVPDFVNITNQGLTFSEAEK